MDRLSDARVTLYGEEVKLSDVLPVPLDQLNDIVDQGGSNVVGAVPQSGKANIVGALCVLNMVAKKPTVIFVGDTVDNVKDMVTNKLNRVFGVFGVTFVYITNKSIAAIVASPSKMSDVRCGKTVLVGIPNVHQLDLFRSLARDVKNAIKDIMMLLDEVDTMWANCGSCPPPPTNDNSYWSDLVHYRKCGSTRINQRERALYMLLTGIGSRDSFPIFHRKSGRLYHNVTRCVVHVSATHMCTLWWHIHANLGYKFYQASEDVLRKNGIVLPCMLQPMDDRDRRPLFLPTMSSRDNAYAMNSPELNAFTEGFLIDDRPMRMMLVATTPFVWSVHDLNLFDFAKHFIASAAEMKKIRHIPVVLIVTGKGIFMQTSAVGKATEVPGMTEDNDEAMLSNAIDYVTDVFGAHVPLIICSYSCTIRCVSVRSKERVLTHVVAAPSKGMNTADVMQLTMRCGGRSTSILEANGFVDHTSASPVVRVLMTKEDFRMVQELSNVCFDILKRAGTGRKQDVANCFEVMLPQMYKDVLLSSRPHCKKQVGLDAAIRSRHALMFDKTPVTLNSYEEALVKGMDDDSAYDEDTHVIVVSKKRPGNTELDCASLRVACKHGLARSIGKGIFEVTEEGIKLVKRIRRVATSTM